jgi:hypothetical protein
MADGLTTDVEVDGLVYVRQLMRDLEPAALKEFDRELTSIAKEIQAGAQANFSRTGDTRSAFSVRTRNRQSGFVKSVTTAGGSVNRGERWGTVPGVIASVIEFAEHASGATPKYKARTEKMLATLTRRYGAPGRNLWEAYDSMSPDLQARAKATVARLEAQLKEALG